MFTIDTNQTIRISRGDDSGQFKLFINGGTAINPCQRRLSPSCIPVVSSKSDSIISYDIDKETWELKTEKKAGCFVFTYSRNQDIEEPERRFWKLDDQEVNLEDYGITIETVELAIDDFIAVSYTDIVEEVQFIIYEINSRFEHFLVKKTFKTDGTIIAENRCGDAYKLKDQDLLIDGDIYLSLLSQDTKMLHPGEYRYKVRAKLFNPNEKKYLINTLIGEREFYIVER